MRRNWRAPIPTADLAYGQIRPNSERINCPPPYGGRDAIYATFVGFLRSQKSERLPVRDALVRRSHIPLKRTREGCARICPRTNPTSGRLLRFSVISARIFVGPL